MQGPSSKAGPDTWTGHRRNPPLDPCGEQRSRALSRACSVWITERKLPCTHPSLLSKYILDSTLLSGFLSSIPPGSSPVTQLNCPGLL